MKKVFIIANWKSNKTFSEAKEWVEQFSNGHFPFSNEQAVITCVPFTLLPMMRVLIDEKKLPITLGAQDVSPFGAGAYTGEVNASQIKEFADYTIVGHSERRNNFGETDVILAKKVQRAMDAGLTPIYCIQNEDTIVPDGITMVAYEPPTAIGTGNPDTPENAEKVAGVVMTKYPQVKNLLYGGSVTSANIKSFLAMDHINGALVGGASLDAGKFIDLIKNASL